MSIMKEEILSQKECLLKTYIFNKEEVIKLAKIIKESNKTHIEIVARGSSKNSAEQFKYELENLTNYRVSFVYPSTVTKYKGTLNKDSIYLAVSQSGRGEDLKIVIEEANRIGALTIGLTNEENSPLNEVCKYNLFMKVDKENSVAATKTFGAEVLVLDMLAKALVGDKVDDYGKVNSLIQLLDFESIENMADKMKNIKNLFVISRGRMLGLAKEACCKLQETCFINANAYASSDFMHGPFALVDDSFNSLFIVPNDETKEDVITLINKTNENKGHSFIIAEEGTDVDGEFVLYLPKLNREEFVFLSIFSVQFIAATIADKLGRDPDKSRNLSKYTKTI